MNLETTPRFRKPLHGLLGATVLFLAGCATPSPRWESPSSLRMEDPNAPGRPELPADGALSLPQSIVLALHRNRELRIERMNPLRAATREEAARGDFAPEGFGLVEVGEEESSETARSTGERFGVEAESRRGEVGVRREFSTGTELEASLSESRDASNRAPTQQEIRADLILTQPLLRGFGTDVVLAEVRQAELGVDISLEELRAYTMAVLAETEIAYWQLSLAERALHITRRALEVSEQQLSEVVQSIETGLLAKNQRAAVDAEVADRRQAVIDAEANLHARRLELGFLLAAEAGTTLQPSDPLEIDTARIEDPDFWVAEAKRLNPEIREARLRLLQEELEVVRTRNGVRPRLDFFAGLAKTGYGDSLGEAADNFDGDTYEWLTGLRVGKELGAARPEAEFRDAVFGRRQAEWAVANLEEEVATRVRRAVVEFNRALAQVAAGEETVRLREKSAEAERDRFEVGTGTSLLVAQAERDLLESRIDDLRNRISFRAARVRLMEVSGHLLSHHGVVVEPGP